MVEKSVKNYIEWCSQNAKRLIFGQRYEDIIVIPYYDIMFFFVFCFFAERNVFESPCRLL